MTGALPLVVAALLGSGPAPELSAVDAAWDAAVAARDLPAFLSRVAPDAVFAGASLQVGREAIREKWSGFFADGGPSLRWKPSDSGMAGSGDLGWTTGNATYAWKEKGVGPSPGRYVTVWVRDGSGRWMAALDSSLEAAATVRASRTPVRTLVSRDGSMETSIGTWERGDGTARKTGIFLTVRERVAETWHTVVDSETETPPAR